MVAVGGGCGKEVMKRKGTLGTLRLSERLSWGKETQHFMGVKWGPWGPESAPGDKGAVRWGEDGGWRGKERSLAMEGGARYSVVGRTMPPPPKTFTA